MKIVKNILLLISYIISIPILVLVLGFFFIISLMNWDWLEDVNQWKLNEYLDKVCDKLTFYMDFNLNDFDY